MSAVLALQPACPRSRGRLAVVGLPPGGTGQETDLTDAYTRAGVETVVVEGASPGEIMRRLRGVHAVHVHGLPHLGSLLALLIAAKRRLPALVSEGRGPFPQSRGGTRVLESATLRANAQVARRTAVAVSVLDGHVGRELRPLLGATPVVEVGPGVDARSWDEVARRHLALLGI